MPPGLYQTIKPLMEGRTIFHGSHQDLTTHLALCVLLSMLLYVPLAYLLSFTGNSAQDLHGFVQTTILNALDFQPERAESLTFLSGVIVIPVLLALLLTIGHATGQQLSDSAPRVCWLYLPFWPGYLCP